MDTGNAETFEPTLDWSREWLHSAQWVATTFVLTLICLLLVLAALARFTVWGRQFWRVSGDYFTGRGSVPVWLLFGFLLLSTVISVRINVLLTYYVNDLFTALQVAFQGGASGAGRDSGIAGFWATMVVFAVLGAVMLSLESFARLARSTDQRESEHPMDIDPSREEDHA